MTYDEALDVLSAIMAAWPQAKAMSDDTANLWVGDLEPLDRNKALDTLNRLRFKLDFPPTTAQFAAAYRELLPRVGPTPHQAPALTRGEAVRQRDLDNVRRIRTELAKIGRRW